jgi:hypothetical protein
MIRYRLQCKKNHQFESWFASSDAFEKLAAKKQVACPECGSKSVEKALMAPGVVKSEAKSPSKRAVKAAAKRAAAAATAAPAAAGPEAPSLKHMAAQKELIEAVRKLRDEVVAKAEYVGPRFSEEARKIHYEEAPARGIYGEATPEEARALLEEGVEVMPLPTLPGDKN